MITKLKNLSLMYKATAEFDYIPRATNADYIKVSDFLGQEFDADLLKQHQGKDAGDIVGEILRTIDSAPA